MENGKKDDFIAVRKKYGELRYEERKKVVQYLKEQGYRILNESRGRGIENYTSGHKLETPYDLSNWMWIEMEKDDMRYLVSFQTFDTGASLEKHLVLPDRLGVCKYKKYSAREAFENMTVTDIDLPMDEDKLSRLLAYLR